MDFVSYLIGPSSWIAIAAVTTYMLYRWGTENFDFFSKQGIPGPKPIPYVGNMWGVWKRNFITHDLELAEKYGRVFGCFDGTVPNLFITDADFVRSVLIKDFPHFINRRLFEFKTKYFRKIVSLIRDEEWKEVRSAISPTFTTGKIKKMSILIKKCATELAEKIAVISKKDGKIDAKKVFSTFTMDVISKCAFGMTIENLGEKDDPFMKNAQVVFSPPVNKSPVILLPFVFPKLASLIGEKYLISKEFSFFFDLLINVVNDRANTKEEYHDFIQVATDSIMEITKESNGTTVPAFTREEVDEIVIAQASIFLLAGFDTTASTLTHTCYLLAKHPDIQEKLYEEIVSKIEKHGEVCHEMILDFPYVEQVINEALRMYPPAPRLERECNLDFSYKNIHIKKGMVVSVPVNALHYSEEYYSEPNKFDPDRWSPENKSKLNPYAFLPFGLGPRNCVGMRFAMEELKIALCSIVSKLRFFPVKETPEKLVFEDGFIGVIQPKDAVIGVEVR
nr:CYP360A7 protein [Diaphanosoma celebensis]